MRPYLNKFAIGLFAHHILLARVGSEEEGRIALPCYVMVVMTVLVVVMVVVVVVVVVVCVRGGACDCM
jgi:heme/copper-type cytochrome/quinol oxidase subunit 2